MDGLRFVTVMTACWVVGSLVNPLSVTEAGGVVSELLPQPAHQSSQRATEDPDDFHRGRQESRTLIKAQTFFAQSDYLSGLKLLQGVLDQPVDLLLDTGDPDQAGSGHVRSLQGDAERAIGKLSQTGRRMYELQFGKMARQKLLDAIRTNDRLLLAEVARRFFHTVAGHEATYRLGSFELDHSEPLAAALCFERLQKGGDVRQRWEPMLSLKLAVAWKLAGYPDRSRVVLAELARKPDADAVQLKGRRETVFRDAELAQAWLQAVCHLPSHPPKFSEDPWSVFRADAAHTSAAAPANPIAEGGWSRSTIVNDAFNNIAILGNGPKLQEFLVEQMQRSRSAVYESSLSLLPALHPLVIGERVICRSLNNIRAFDLKTGAMLWQTAMTDSVLAEIFRQITGVSNQPRVSPFHLFEDYLNQRWYLDLTSGTLSSDGNLVFAVEGTRLFGIEMLGISRARNPLYFDGTNRLVAFELSTGRLKWEIGGPQGAQKLPLAGRFFLAPPLPLRGHLYCLAVESGETHLLVLDPNTGQRIWSQSMSDSDGRPLPDLKWLYTGIGPSFADGILVCSTGAGGVIGIDLSRQRPLWFYRYRAADTYRPSAPRALMMQALQQSQLVTQISTFQNRWADSAPTIAEGCVVLTPVDSDELHCVRLCDGTLLWKRPRHDGLYVATIFDGAVIVPGRTHVTAFRLADGEPAWKQDIPIPVPSGRGFRSGTQYYLPLSTAEVLAIDLTDGRILARSKTPQGQPIGNLAAAGGTVVSQTTDTISAFPPLDRIRERLRDELSRHPNDAAALARRGELRLHLGDVTRGLADLRRSLQMRPNTRSRNLLLTRLLDDLRFDFARHQEVCEEIERFIETPDQRATYLRLRAEGLQRLGKLVPALHSYLQLAVYDAETPLIESPDGRLATRRDRWVRARIQTLYASAAPQLREQLDHEIFKQLERANAQNDIEQLRLFVSAVDGHKSADTARQELVRRLDDKTHALELEFHLRRLRNAPDLDRTGFATARLATLLVEHDCSEDAAPLIRELSTKWSNVVCLNKQTGQQVAQALEHATRLPTEQSNNPDWPRKVIHAEIISKRNLLERTLDLPLTQTAEPTLKYWTVVLQTRRQFLQARDRNDQVRWEFPLAGISLGLPYIGSNFVSASGHRFLIAFGDRFLVLDTLAKSSGSRKRPASSNPQAEQAAKLESETTVSETPGKSLPRLLWGRTLHEINTPGERSRFVQSPTRLQPAGRRRALVIDALGHPVGTVAAVADNLLCYQVGSTVYAADPLTGQTVWLRRSVSRGSEIFGDGRQVVLVAPQTNVVTILRASDGERIDEKPFPDIGTRLVTHGRRVLTWQPQQEHRLLGLFDLHNETAIWQKEFSDRAIVTVVDRDEVAVVEPEGRLTVARISDGAILLDTAFAPAVNVSQAFVLASLDQYVLLTSSSEPTQTPQTRGLAFNANHPVINGKVDGFNKRTGKHIWSTNIRRAAIDLTQPQNLPILVFVTKRLELPIAANNRSLPPVTPPRFSVLVLDKRTGKIVYQNDHHPPISVIRTVATSDHQEIRIESDRTSIILTFTNEALTPPGTAPSHS